MQELYQTRTQELSSYRPIEVRWFPIKKTDQASVSRLSFLSQ